MLRILEQTLGNSYKGSLYKALLLLAYYACLRAGEIVVSNSKVHTLNFENLSFMDKGSLAIQMQTFKHCSEPVTLMLSKLPTEPYCPVIANENYLTLRGNCSGPIFINEEKVPLRRKDFAGMLKSCMQKLGMKKELYNTHSFRIGRATDLALLGLPDHVIRSTGRWRSNAYTKYIRASCFELPCV